MAVSRNCIFLAAWKTAGGSSPVTFSHSVALSCFLAQGHSGCLFIPLCCLHLVLCLWPSTNRQKKERNSSRLLCLGIKTSGRTHESIICRGYFYLADHFSSRETSLQLSRGCFCQLQSGQVGPGASHLCSEGHGVGWMHAFLLLSLLSGENIQKMQLERGRY